MPAVNRYKAFKEHMIKNDQPWTQQEVTQYKLLKLKYQKRTHGAVNCGFCLLFLVGLVQVYLLYIIK